MSNQAFISHGWSAPGVYTVSLMGYNDSFPEGVGHRDGRSGRGRSLLRQPSQPDAGLSLHQLGDGRDGDSGCDCGGDTPGRLVLVTNGVYRERRGGVDEPGGGAELNGPEVTVIMAGGRCAAPMWGMTPA